MNVKHIRDKFAAIKTSHDEGWARGKVKENRRQNRRQNRGKLEGKIEKGRGMLLLLFSQKLGPIPQDIAGAINTLTDETKIDAIVAHFIKINDWETLQKYLE
jgi:hypothetical protein